MYNHELSHHHYEPSLLKNFDWDELNVFIYNMDKEHVNQPERQKIRDRKRCLLSYRRQLTDNNLTLQAAYEGTGFHLCPTEKFEQKASDFMLVTGVYSPVP
jgi:hypothetical protein